MTRKTFARGAGLAGYGLIVGLIALIAILAASQVGNQTSRILVGAGAAVSGIQDETTPGPDHIDPGTPASGNAAPIFTGTLPTIPTLVRDTAMTPVVITGFSDPDGDDLSFSRDGDWPDGITLTRIDNTSVQIGGTPIEAGMFDTLTVRASDGTLETQTPAFSINILAPSGSFGLGVQAVGKLGVGGNAATWRGLGTPETMTQIVAQGHNGWAIDTDGDVWGIGWTSYGQIGGSTSPNASATWRHMPADGKFIRITGGDGFALALREDGILFGIGNDTGSILGGGGNRNSWHQLSTETWRDVSAGYASANAWAIRHDGTIWGIG